MQEREGILYCLGRRRRASDLRNVFFLFVGTFLVKVDGDVVFYVVLSPIEYFLVLGIHIRVFPFIRQIV